MQLPEDYIISKFYAYCNGVKYHKYTQTYNGGCYICKEGTSWLKKKRCYYLLKESVICCHNCGWYSSPIKWIAEVTGMSYRDIYKDAETYEIIPSVVKEQKPKKTFVPDKFPHDPINLLDKSQVLYYRDSSEVRDVLRTMYNRRLITAVNRPKSLYTSLTDKTHANRLIIPCYDERGDIVFYQSRGIREQDLKNKPKYLSKIGGDKGLFNIDKVDASYAYIFIFEGPINSFFCKNGIAVGGIQEKGYNTFTPLQAQQIKKFPLHQKIWVLDSQWIDNASLNKTERLIELGENVFIWPQAEGTKFKDFNDIAIAQNRDEISPQFVLDNTFRELEATVRTAEIKRSRKSNTPS